MWLKSERRQGAVAALVAVCLIAVLSAVAIALDAGMLVDNRHRVQAAADAAALAAAADLYDHWAANHGQDTSGTARSSALSVALANGYDNDGVTSFVTVSIPPLSGPGMNKPGYAEVSIRYNQTRGLSTIFASGDLPVIARAVARGRKQATTVGVLMLNPSAQGALTLTGSSAITVLGKVIVDSSHTKAAVSSGSATLTSSTMDITGGYSSSSTSSFQANPRTTGVAPTPDFLSDLPVPDPTAIDDYGNPGMMTLRSNSIYRPVSGEVLQPGIYVGGISISSKPNVTFAPGIYYLKGGGMVMSGSSSRLTANGVMLYNAPSASGITGPITISGGGVVVQSPLNSGTYYGMSIFQNRTSTQRITLSGASGWNFTGTVYAPKGELIISGGSGATMGSQFIADIMTLSGSSTFNNIDPSTGYARRDIRLIE